MKLSATKARQGILGVATAAVLTVGFILTPLAQADRFDEQIKELREKNNASQQEVSRLQAVAESYEGEINRLQAEIDAVRKLIAENQAKRDDLQRQIEAAQAELDKQKALLGESIKAMYVQGEISTFEMLASSKDLSEFLDKQQYRSNIQQKIKITLDQINELKAQLRSQKDLVEKLLADQEAMNGTLTASQNEQARLLNLTQSEKAAYNKQIKENNAQINELRRQQIIENSRFSGGTPGTGPACGGGYPGHMAGPWGPWGCNYPIDYNIDKWGMYNRQCVSYTAFKVWSSGRHMPYWGGRGNANQWDDNARAAGIPVDNKPRVGDVAVSNSGYYGHVMYVEHVYEDGRILISQYNASWDGRYSEKVIWPGNLVFIHFP